MHAKGTPSASSSLVACFACRTSRISLLGDGTPGTRHDNNRFCMDPTRTVRR